MKINNQYQNQHTPADAEVDWVLVQKVERDICLLYHQQAEYSFIMGDLYYGDVYTLPYWEYLNLTNVDDDKRRFIRDGCLVMILAMCWDEIDGSGFYIGKHLSSCTTYVSNLTPENDESSKLREAVLLALQTLKEKKTDSPELFNISAWVHKTYVRGYFKRTAKNFETNPYFKE